MKDGMGRDGEVGTDDDAQGGEVGEALAHIGVAHLTAQRTLVCARQASTPYQHDMIAR
jgi:hypothetical protein